MLALPRHWQLVVITTLLYLTKTGSSVSNGCSDVCDFSEWAKDAKCQERNLVAVPQQCSIAKTLRLQDNKLAQLARGSFSNFTCLKYLFLERNNLTVERGSFEGCSMVERLQLNDNNLHELTTETMEGLSDVLLVLLVDNSEVTEVHPLAFRNLSKLQFLSLKHNKLTSPPCQAFTDKNDLQTIYLSGNRISSLPNGCFLELTHLTKLFLKDNPLGLGDMNEGAFRGLGELKYFDLRNNSLASVPAGVFRHTSQVETLQLSNNKIEHLFYRDFASLTGLKNLYLQNNNLMTIHPLSFEFLSSLEILDLSNNGIRSIGKDALKEQSNLKELRLQNNSLTSTNNISFSSIPHDAMIDLSNNPLHCDCSINHFMYWLERATQEIPESSQAVCASPSKFAGRLVSELTQSDICPYTSHYLPGTDSQPESETPNVDSGAPNDPYNAQHSASGDQTDPFSNVQLIAIITGVIVAVILLIGIVILLRIRKMSHMKFNHGYMSQYDSHQRQVSITSNPLDDKPPLPPRDMCSLRNPSVTSTQPLLGGGPNSPTLTAVNEVVDEGYASSFSHPQRPSLAGQSSQTSNNSSSDSNKSYQDDVFYSTVGPDNGEQLNDEEEDKDKQEMHDFLREKCQAPNPPVPHPQPAEYVQWSKGATT